jgi:hypothetical protein
MPARDPPGREAMRLANKHRSLWMKCTCVPERHSAQPRQKAGWTAVMRRGCTGSLERAKGIEPSYAAWEAAVLPLNYARKPMLFLPRQFQALG